MLDSRNPPIYNEERRRTRRVERSSAYPHIASAIRLTSQTAPYKRRTWEPTIDGTCASKRNGQAGRTTASRRTSKRDKGQASEQGKAWPSKQDKAQMGRGNRSSPSLSPQSSHPRLALPLALAHKPLPMSRPTQGPASPGALRASHC